MAAAEVFEPVLALARAPAATFRGWLTAATDAPTDDAGAKVGVMARLVWPAAAMVRVLAATAPDTLAVRPEEGMGAVRFAAAWSEVRPLEILNAAVASDVRRADGEPRAAEETLPLDARLRLGPSNGDLEVGELDVDGSESAAPPPPWVARRDGRPVMQPASAAAANTTAPTGRPSLDMADILSLDA